MNSSFFHRRFKSTTGISIKHVFGLRPVKIAPPFCRKFLKLLAKTSYKNKTPALLKWDQRLNQPACSLSSFRELSRCQGAHHERFQARPGTAGQSFPIQSYGAA